MKLTDQEKLELFRTAFAALIALGPERWPKTAPPKKDGTRKHVEPTFGVAIWADKLANTAVYVLERDDPHGAEAPRTDSGAVADATPF